MSDIPPISAQVNFESNLDALIQAAETQITEAARRLEALTQQPLFSEREIIEARIPLARIEQQIQEILNVSQEAGIALTEGLKRAADEQLDGINQIQAELSVQQQRRAEALREATREGREAYAAARREREEEEAAALRQRALRDEISNREREALQRDELRDRLRERRLEAEEQADQVVKQVAEAQEQAAQAEAERDARRAEREASRLEFYDELQRKVEEAESFQEAAAQRRIIREQEAAAVAAGTAVPIDEGRALFQASGQVVPGVNADTGDLLGGPLNGQNVADIQDGGDFFQSIEQQLAAAGITVNRTAIVAGLREAEQAVRAFFDSAAIQAEESVNRMEAAFEQLDADPILRAYEEINQKILQDLGQDEVSTNRRFRDALETLPIVGGIGQQLGAGIDQLRTGNQFDLFGAQNQLQLFQQNGIGSGLGGLQAATGSRDDQEATIRSNLEQILELRDELTELYGDEFGATLIKPFAELTQFQIDQLNGLEADLEAQRAAYQDVGRVIELNLAAEEDRADFAEEVEAITRTRVEQLRIEQGITDDLRQSDLDRAEIQEIINEVTDDAIAAGLDVVEVTEIVQSTLVEINEEREREASLIRDAYLELEILQGLEDERGEKIGNATQALADQRELLRQIGQDLQTDIVGALDVDEEDDVGDVREARDNVREANLRAAERVNTLDDRLTAADIARDLGLNDLVAELLQGNADGLLDEILYGDGDAQSLLFSLNEELERTRELEVALNVYADPNALEEAFAEIQARVEDYEAELEDADPLRNNKNGGVIGVKVDPVVQAFLEGGDIAALGALAREENAPFESVYDGIDPEAVITAGAEDGTAYTESVLETSISIAGERGGEIFEALSDGAGNLLDEAGGIVGLLFGGDGATSREGPTKDAYTREISEGLFSGVVTNITDALGGLDDTVSQNLKFDASAAAIEAEGAVLAGSLYDGLIGLLEDRVEDLEGAAGKTANALIQTLKRLLGIESPSRVMRLIGEDSIAGLIQGLEGDELEARVEQINSTLSGIGRGLSSSIADAFNEAIPDGEDSLGPDDDRTGIFASILNVQGATRAALDSIDKIQERAAAVQRLQQFGGFEAIEEQVAAGNADEILQEIIFAPNVSLFELLNDELENANALAEDLQVGIDVDADELFDVIRYLQEFDDALEFTVEISKASEDIPDVPPSDDNSRVPAEWGWVGWNPGRGVDLTVGESWRGPEAVVAGYHPTQQTIDALKQVDAYAGVRDSILAMEPPNVNVSTPIHPEVHRLMSNLDRAFGGGQLDSMVEELADLNGRLGQQAWRV